MNVNLAHHIERFLNLLDLSHVSFWKGAHRKRLERRGPTWKIDWTSLLCITFKWTNQIPYFVALPQCLVVVFFKRSLAKSSMENYFAALLQCFVAVAPRPRTSRLFCRKGGWLDTVSTETFTNVSICISRQFRDSQWRREWHEIPFIYHFSQIKCEEKGALQLFQSSWKQMHSTLVR